MKYKNIIFDLGGVIENIAPEKVTESFKAIGMQNAEDFFSLYRQSDICSQFETGAISSDMFIEIIRKNCSNNVDHATIINAWCANQLGVKLNTLNVIRELKKRNYKLYILSNTNAVHYEKILRIFFQSYKKDFREFFDDIYLSYVIGKRKPSDEPYQHMINSGIAPTESIYIDDLSENLHSPKKLGFLTILHETNNSIEYLLDRFA